MLKILLALAIGAMLGSSGLAVAASLESWRHNGVFCWSVQGKPTNRGIACRRQGSQKIAIVNQRSIIVGDGNRVLYVTAAK